MRLAAGAGWQLLIAVVEALVEARVWKFEGPLPNLCEGLEGEGAHLSREFGEG